MGETFDTTQGEVYTFEGTNPPEQIAQAFNFLASLWMMDILI